MDQTERALTMSTRMRALALSAILGAAAAFTAASSSEAFSPESVRARKGSGVSQSSTRLWPIRGPLVDLRALNLKAVQAHHRNGICHRNGCGK